MDTNISSQESKLIGDLSSYNDNLSNIYPSYLRNKSNIYSIISTWKDITWEKQGKELLSKTYFTQSDIRIAKLCLLKGIPDADRGEFWFIASGAKKEMLDHPNYYSFLLNNYPVNIILPNEKQIDLDVSRTYPNISNNSEWMTKWKNILLTYTKRNQSIGYVQGFNFIVGKWWNYVDNEEKAFWIFTMILENILPLNYYTQLAGVMIDVDILICLLNQRYFKDLSNSMKEGCFMFLKNIFFQWFLSLFNVYLSEKASVIIWDVFFLEKSITLFKSAIIILKLYKQEWLDIKDLESLQFFINQKFTKFESDQWWITSWWLRKYEFDQTFIDINRNEISGKIISNINWTNQIKIEKLKESVNKKSEMCNNSWPYCLYETDSLYSVNDYFVLQSGNKINFNFNYFVLTNEKDNWNTSSVYNGEGDEVNTNVSGYNSDYYNSFPINQSFISFKFEDVITYKSVWIERKEHFCSKGYYSADNSLMLNEKDKDKKRSNGYKNPEKGSRGNINNTQPSSSKNINEALHTDIKNKYRYARRRQHVGEDSSFNSNDLINNNHWTISPKKKHIDNQVNNRSKRALNYETFVSKMNFKYNLVSQANIYHLIKKETPQQSDRQYSIYNFESTFL